MVGGDGNIVNRVANVIRQRHAGGGVVGQDDDAFVLVGNAQLALRTSHRIRFDATDLLALEHSGLISGLVGVDDGGTFAGIDHFQGLG